MKQSHINDNTKKPKKSLHYKQYFQKDIFDEEFLNEKDKALSPIILTDKIPGENKKETPIKKGKNNYIKIEEGKIYGSNIIYIDSEIDDNGKEEFCSILNEQINNIKTHQKFCAKYPIKKIVRRKKI